MANYNSAYTGAQIDAAIAAVATKLSWTKLWENASPSSSFAAQTLSLDLSGYDAVAYFVRNATNGSVYWASGVVPIGYKTTIQYTTASGGWYVYSRTATANSSGIVFEAGKLSGDTDTTSTIPICIFGIKGVQ